MVNDISQIDLDQLMGVINAYPWYSAARKELCVRMHRSGAWSRAQYAEASLYFGSRKIVADLLDDGVREDCSDDQLTELLKAFIADLQPAAPVAAPAPVKEPEPEAHPVYVVGGDYFSRDQYDRVKRKSDNIFSRFATQQAPADYSMPEYDPGDLCTETLAQIYLDQGYKAEAREIYSKLILRYPEKSVYFASLIEKIDKN